MTEHEPDWSPLTRAMRDATWAAQIILPREAERRLVAELVDALTAEGVVLVETGSDDAAS